MTEQPEGLVPQVQIAPEMRGGVWSNFAVVSHTPYEFTIDFTRMDFAHADDGTVPGVVVSRVNLSPLMVTELLQALQDNWTNYAAKAMPREVHDDGSIDEQ